MLLPEGNAIVYCQGAFNTTNGKTAHGLVRFTKRYHVMVVVDKRYQGQDAGEVLDGKIKNIPIVGSVKEAIAACGGATHLVVGLAPDGGRLPGEARQEIVEALQAGLHVDSGLHDYLSNDEELASLAKEKGSEIRDIRKPLTRTPHFFSGKISEVSCLKVAILGTDSAVGKRTTAWQLVHALQAMEKKAEMIGTGQTAWLQGARYGVIFDSLVNDFVAGEIENAVYQAWQEQRPEVIVIEGQGSLMNPAYPGGFEILAAGRPDVVIVQHAPARKEYDGFPGYPIHPLLQQIQLIELLSGKPVIAITVNHEDLAPAEIPYVVQALSQAVGLPSFDVLLNGAGQLAEVVLSYDKERK